MKIIFITGTHSRHSFIAQALASTGFLSALILEQREEMLPPTPSSLNVKQKELFNHHFQSRQAAELNGFGKVNFPDVPTSYISRDELNQQVVQSLIKDCNPDLLLTYGCNMLSKETLDCAKGEKWNCHGGLSPWYRGSITHFWPSYMLEPQMTGMTVHDLTSQLDAGDVIHQCVAPLVRGDKLHDLAVKAVKTLAEELPQLINIVAEKKAILKKSHTTNGMLWLASMWRPEHLEVIYKQYGDSIVDYYLDGKFQQKSPNLHRQF
jgi:methionyl-tRNA formyltransferase